MIEATYRTLTYAFRVRTTLPDVGQRVDELLAPFRFVGANGVPTFEIREHHRGAPFRVHQDGRLVLRSRSLAGALDYVLWRASTETIERASDFLVLHAGAVSAGTDGIVLPAPPDSGKTTLTAGLVRAGFGYLSDEAAFLDPRTGLVHPFPRALWMDRATLDVVPEMRRSLRSLVFDDRAAAHVDPTELRERAIGSPCRVRYVVVPNYRRGPTMLESIGRAEAVVTLAENTFNLERFGASGVRLLVDVVREAECYRLTMGNLDAALEAVRQIVGEVR
jgi:hypothetical protein